VILVFWQLGTSGWFRSTTLRPRVPAGHWTPTVADTMSGSTLRLYRHILKAAKTFPSKNRAGLIEEIKTEFRENAGATDAGDVQKKLALARDGLDRMRAFTGLDQGASKWDVSLKGPYDGT